MLAPASLRVHNATTNVNIVTVDVRAQIGLRELITSDTVHATSTCSSPSQCKARKGRSRVVITVVWPAVTAHHAAK